MDSAVRYADGVGGGTPTFRRLTVVATCLGLSGCVAMQLSSRGAPEAELREFEVRLEPVDLPEGHGEGHEDAKYPAPLWVTIPASGWLHGFDVALVDGEGEPVSPEVLHHFKVMSPNRRELFSPIMLHLAGGGAETKPVELPPKAGFPIVEGDSLLVTAMLHNPTGHSLRGVQFRVTLRYSPRGPWKPPLEVVPFFTHVTPPTSDAAYDLPPGRSHKSIKVTPAVDGWIIGLGGHLHRFGTLLRLEDIDEGRVLWEKVPTRSADGTVLDIPTDRFVWSRGPRLRSHHTYRVTAFYDNPTPDTIPDGGMGTLGGAFVPDEPWPDVDRHSEVYRSYLERELTMGMTKP